MFDLNDYQTSLKVLKLVEATNHALLRGCAIEHTLTPR
jgi:hypothetical protein